jgi:hypothetical protein
VKHIYAFTEPPTADAYYPAYVRIHELDNAITITVRGPNKPPGSCPDNIPFDMPGDIGSISLSRDEATRLRQALEECTCN